MVSLWKAWCRVEVLDIEVDAKLEKNTIVKLDASFRYKCSGDAKSANNCFPHEVPYVNVLDGVISLNLDPTRVTQ